MQAQALSPGSAEHWRPVICAILGLSLVCAAGSTSASADEGWNQNVRYELTQAQYGTPYPSPYGSAYQSPDVAPQAGPYPSGYDHLPYTIQTRGPVHEAFAEPVMFEPTAGFTVPRQPPRLIDERPSEYYPAGDNVSWFPGYWGWDDDRSDFLWVSGTWRNIPQGRQFVPGYWMPAATGYQWVPGFWAPVGTQTIQYLPPPPPPLQTRLIGQPPGPGHIWVPGVWVWQVTGYTWRQGYWMPPRQDYVWVPDHYVWTPSGYVFVSGYWDHTLDRRGTLFAPAYMPAPVVAQPRFSYTPSVLVNVTLLFDDLFARPQYGHYYFGDYYDPGYHRAGILPAFEFHERRVGHDPLLVGYASRRGMTLTDVFSRFRGEYTFLRDNPRVRPPRTFAAMARLSGRRDLDPRLASRVRLAESPTQLQRRGDLPSRVQRLQPDRLDTFRRTATDTRRFQEDRRRLETAQTRTGRTIDRPTSIDLLRGDRQIQRPTVSSVGRTPAARSNQPAARSNRPAQREAGRQPLSIERRQMDTDED